MEMFLVVVLVVIAAALSYVRGRSQGLAEGHFQGLFNGTVISELSHAILQADRELREQGLDEELEEPEFNVRLQERVDEILEEKFSDLAK